MYRSRESSQKKNHKRNVSVTNYYNESLNSNDQSIIINSPYFLHESLIFMLQKIVQLTEILIKSDKNMNSSHISPKPTLLNLTEKKKQMKSYSPSTPPLSLSYKQQENSMKINDIKSEFQKIKQRLVQYKNNDSIKKNTSESPIIRTSFDNDQQQIRLIKIEEEYKNQIMAIKNRVETVEQDMGELMMLYKEVLFAK